HLVDDFEHQGPNGTHVCLVFELMGETLLSFAARFKDSRIPYWAMRNFTMELLAALDFAHDHNVIHTGALSLTVLGERSRLTNSQTSNRTTSLSNSGTPPSSSRDTLLMSLSLSKTDPNRGTPR